MLLSAFAISEGVTAQFRLPLSQSSDFLQDAIDHLSRTGGGVLLIEDQQIVLQRPLILRPGVFLQGGAKRPTLIVPKRGMRAFDLHDGPKIGSAGLSNLAIIGPAARIDDRGDERDRLVVVGPFDEVRCEQLFITGSRWISLSPHARKVEVSGCTVTKGYRDGIQVYDAETAIIRNNHISQVADDGISFLVSRSSISIPTALVQIEGNSLDQCSGIKVLGGSNVLVGSNIMSQCIAYGVFIGCDDNFHEGCRNQSNINIIGNRVDSLRSLSLVSQEEGVASITFMGGQHQQTIFSGVTVMENTTSFYQGEPTSTWWTSGQASIPAHTQPIRPLPSLLLLRGEYRKLKISANTFSSGVKYDQAVII